MTKLLIAGATGLVGGHVLALALADDRVTEIIAPTRRPIAPHDKLQNPLTGNEPLPPDAPWWSVDAAICALGTTRAKAGSAAAFRAVDHDYILALARHVRDGGASRFVLTSSMGANASSPLLYPRTKGEVEEAVRQLGFPSLTIARPGVLGGKRQEHRTGERMAERLLRQLAPILPPGARISPAETVAALLLEAATGAGPGTHLLNAADIARAAIRKAP